MGDRRGGPDYYHSNHDRPHFQKRHKPNDYHSRTPHSSGYQKQHHSQSNSHRGPGGGYQNHSSKNAIDFDTLPPPEKCQPCKLSKAEIQTGLISMLDQLADEETGPEGDQEIRSHALALQKLLTTRHKSSYQHKTLDLDKNRPAKGLEGKGKYTHLTPSRHLRLQLASQLPTLPPIREPTFKEAVFTHRSKITEKNPDTLTYERLEFLGDAYIEVISSRLIFSRFPHLDEGQQSQLREGMVKNEKLALFANAYGFGDRIAHGSHELHEQKAWTKVLADVFEAYVTAVILSDEKEGFQVAEEWLTELWAPQLLEYKDKPVENLQAKGELMKWVGGRGVKIEYKQERNMQIVDGLQVYAIGCYMTGWGYHEEWLGSGEGQSMAKAGAAAATDALTRSKGVLLNARRKKLEMYPESMPLEHEVVGEDGKTRAKDENGQADVKRGEENSEEKQDATEIGDKKRKKKDKEQRPEEEEEERKRKKREKKERKKSKEAEATVAE